MNIYSLGRAKIVLVQPTDEELTGFQSYRRRNDEAGNMRMFLLDPITGFAFVALCMLVMLMLNASNPPLALLVPIAIAVIVPQLVASHLRYKRHVKQYNRMVDDDRALRFNGDVMVGLKTLLIKGGRNLTQDQLVELVSSGSTVKHEVGLYLTSRTNRKNLQTLGRLRTEGARDYLRESLLPGAQQLLLSVDVDIAASMLHQNLLAELFEEELRTMVELQEVTAMVRPTL